MRNLLSIKTQTLVINNRNKTDPTCVQYMIIRVKNEINTVIITINEMRRFETTVQDIQSTAPY